MSGRVEGRVTVVVLTWNNRTIIEPCLRSIRALEWPDVEILVVDNGSTDGSVQYLQQQPDVRLIALSSNRGFAGGQVAAWSHITGQLAALVNSDAVLAPDWLLRLVPEMDDPSVGAAGGRAYDWPPHEEPGSTDGPYSAHQVVDRRTGRTTTLRQADAPTDVHAISGAAVLLRTSSVEAVGGFDERFFAYYEETDLFARMLRAGLRIRYVPTAHAWHQIRGSSASDPDMYEFYMRRNMALFFLRNFDPQDCRAAAGAYARDLAHVLQRRDHTSRVAARACLSLLTLLPHAAASRRRIRALGGTYGQRLAMLEEARAS